MDSPASRITPKSYVPEILRQIARMDLDVHKENKRRYGDKRPYLRYAFAADHVRRADGSVARLLKLAIEEPDRATRSHLLERRRLYGLQEGLRAAFTLERGTTHEHIDFQTSDTPARDGSRRRLHLTAG